MTTRRLVSVVLLGLATLTVATILLRPATRERAAAETDTTAQTTDGGDVQSGAPEVETPGAAQPSRDRIADAPEAASPATATPAPGALETGDARPDVAPPSAEPGGLADTQPPVDASHPDLALPVPVPLPPEFQLTVREFAAELDDQEWSANVEGEIYGVLSRVTGLGAIDIQVDCRTTLCRLRIVHPQGAAGPQARDPVQAVITETGLQARWMFAVFDENGLPVSLAYFAREGTATPHAVGTIRTAAR